MASPDESWNAAAICQALGCPGCFDCREDDSDATWDGKDEDPEDGGGSYWACPKPDCDTPRDEPGDCPVHEIPLLHIGPDGHEVTT